MLHNVSYKPAAPSDRRWAPRRCILRCIRGPRPVEVLREPVQWGERRRYFGGHLDTRWGGRHASTGLEETQVGTKGVARRAGRDVVHSEPCWVRVPDIPAKYFSRRETAICASAVPSSSCRALSATLGPQTPDCWEGVAYRRPDDGVVRPLCMIVAVSLDPEC